jgi:hypothetical protein
MRSLRQVGVVLALMLVASSVASAQARPKVLEFGTDAALSFGLDDPNTTMIRLPVGNFRVGIHTSPVISIEPFGEFSWTKIEGVDDAISGYNFGAGMLYHFSANRQAPQMYVRPFLSLVGASVGGTSNSEFGVGVGLGYKFAPKWSGRFQWRGEANLFSIEDATSLNLLWGVSLYPR